MSDLVTRLQSEGPSRELDAEITLANGWIRHRATVVGLGDLWESPTGQICPNVPRYTESIDTALTLMPEECAWSLTMGEEYYAKVWRSVHELHRGTATTPALALLIAICKAKEESKT